MTERLFSVYAYFMFFLVGAFGLIGQANVHAGSANDTVSISIPDVWASPGQTISVPISISPVTVEEGIYALQGTFTYYGDILTGISVMKELTLTEIWSPNPTSNVLKRDSLLFAFGGEYPIEGSGALVTVVFKVNDSAQVGQTSPIHFDTLTLNEGNPYSVTHDALFTVGEASQIEPFESEYDFGAVDVGDSAEWQVSVSNRGVADLIISDVSSNSDQIQIHPIALPTTLATTENLDIKVTYRPSAVESLVAHVKITCNDPLQPVVVIPLSGAGTSVATAIEDPIALNQTPDAFGLLQNYPNPFNPVTSIQYSVISDQSSPRITLKIYNVLGQEVRTLVDTIQEPGYYSVLWDARDEQGNEVTSGIYFYKLTTENFVQTKRMAYIR